METFKDRLKTELDSLLVKVDKLDSFINSDVYKNLSELDKDDLKEQFIHMSRYLSVLDKRVKRIC